MAFLGTLFANFFAVFLVLAFIAVVLLIEGLYLLWNATRSPEAKKLERRLHALAAGASPGEEASILKQRMLNEAPRLERLLLAVPRVRGLDRLIEQSGLALTVTRLLALSAGLGLVALALAAASPLPFAVAAALGAGAATLPALYVGRCRARRMRRIERQLPDALDLVCRALRAGHAFSAGLQMVGEEMPEPIGGEFRITHEEVNFGVSLQQALLNLAARVPSTDMRYFVVAVMIQRDSGGNLTEVLGNLAMLIRERFKLLEKVRVLAAEGRLSAWILGLLPFGVAAAINVINPGFMQVLWTDPLGSRMVGAALVCEALGILWMRQIIRIRV
ncbi:MAG TPA: type II secretion system F family protein [Rhodocyclaceae bacterium]